MSPGMSVWLSRRPDSRMPLYRRHYSTLYWARSADHYDRIDLHIEVPAVAYRELRGKESGATSAEMRKPMLTAQAVQAMRGSISAGMPSGRLRKICRPRPRPDPQGGPNHRRPGS